ncbi:Lsr2 family DNA-binding protein [Rhodococcus koreensis]
MAVSPRGSAGSAKTTTKEIRQWAIGAGLEVSARGRISAEIEQAFHDAHARTAPAEPKKVTRSAAKKAIAESTTAKKRAAKKIVGETASTNRAAASKAPTKKTTKQIREWAIGAGLEVSSRGRISAEIEQAFDDAQAKRVQTEPAPVKKTSAKKAAAKTTAAPTAPVKRLAANTAPAKKTAVKKKAAASTDPAEKAAVKKKAAAAPVTSASVSTTPAKKTTKQIREWAIGAGHVVSSRGRIPAELKRAFHDAQAAKARTRTAPARKVSAKKAAGKKGAGKTSASPTAPGTRAATSKAPGKRTAAKKEAAEKIPVTSASVNKVSAKKTSREIREWAIGEGHVVSSRGRIPADVERAFHDAQAALPVA